MTGEQKYSPAAQAVINDYLDRLKCRLSGFPPADREDLLREIVCHIDESFAAETGVEEMERLLRVLRRLGEPSDVISERMSPAMIQMGKKKGLPFYILAGTMITFVGLPFGLGAAAMLIGLLATLFGLLIAYFATALSFLVSGVIGMVISVIVMVAPGIIESINAALGGKEVVHMNISGSILNLPPETEAIIAFLVCALLVGIGYFMMRGGRRLIRDTGYLLKVSWEKMVGIFDRYRRSVAEKNQSTWIGSTCRT